MRPVIVSHEGVVAEVAGGWILPPSSDDADRLPIRLDDGQSAMCLADGRVASGDRAYRVLYGGDPIHGGRGVEIHDVSADMVQSACRPAVRRIGKVYAAMAAVPLSIMICLMVARTLYEGPTIPDALVLCIASAALVPLGMWCADQIVTRRNNRKKIEALEGCRRLAREAIDQDVSVWKERLTAALPASLDTAGNAVIRGSACRIVEGTSSVDGDVPQIIKAGRPITLPREAVEICGLEDGDLVHALVPAGRIPASPVGISNPLTGRTWTDDAIAGGPDGAPHRASIRAVLGRAAWSIVTRQWDEIGRRRRNARRA